MNINIDQLAARSGAPRHWVTEEKVASVMNATGCSCAVAAEYLLSEEGCVSDAVTSFVHDSEAV